MKHVQVLQHHIGSGCLWRHIQEWCCQTEDNHSNVQGAVQNQRKYSTKSGPKQHTGDAEVGW